MSSATYHVIDQQLSGLIPAFQRYYERAICQDLSCHQCQGLFERNLLKTAEKLFDDAFTLVEQQRIALANMDVAQIQSLAAELDSLVQQGKDQLLSYALNYNRSSCALSNFPDEHRPSPEYFAQVLMKLEGMQQQWKDHLNSFVFTA